MIKTINGISPQINDSCFVIDECSISGDVILREKVNVWYYAVLRGDVNKIQIGKYTNVQDGAIIHVTKENATTIGEYVTIGHGAKLHGCTVHDHALIGIGAIILDGAEIGKGSIIAAGTVIPPNKQIPENVLVMGNPYKIVRPLEDKEKSHILENCLRYAEEYPNPYK